MTLSSETRYYIRATAEGMPTLWNTRTCWSEKHDWLAYLGVVDISGDIIAVWNKELPKYSFQIIPVTITASIPDEPKGTHR